MTTTKKGPSRRAYWTKQLHQWHWISSAICLVAMLLFTITGITLNHADAIAAQPETQKLSVPLPDDLLASLSAAPPDGKAALPEAVREWVNQQFDLRVGEQPAEWSDGEIYLSLPRPGGDGFVSIDLDKKQAKAEQTNRGWVAYFNDLHKGRNTGTVWRWFIDIFAVACLAFCLTGIVLLYLHSRHRRMTWPVVLAGLFIPLLLAIFLIH